MVSDTASFLDLIASACAAAPVPLPHSSRCRTSCCRSLPAAAIPTLTATAPTTVVTHPPDRRSLLAAVALLSHATPPCPLDHPSPPGRTPSSAPITSPSTSAT